MCQNEQNDSWAQDWSSLSDGLVETRNMFVVGRGFGLAAAQEAALKFKETCGLHAEGFSAAEVKHGPMTLVGPGFPLLRPSVLLRTLPASESAPDSAPQTYHQTAPASPRG